MELLTKNKDSHWWLDQNNQTNKKWAIQDKSGTWWLVNGSEFPEKKLSPKEGVKENIKKKIIKNYDSSLVILACALGISAGINLALILKIIL